MCLCVRALFILDFYLVFEATQSLWWTEKIRAEERRWINERTADQLVLNLPWWIFNIWTETELTVEQVNGRKDEGLPDRSGQKKIFRLCAYDFTSRDENENCGQAFFYSEGS